MKKARLLNSFLLITFLLLGMNFQIAQESISTAGDDIESTTGFLTYTIGEVATSTFESENGSLAQGFNQPFGQELLAVPTMDQWGISICLLSLIIIGVIIIKSQDITHLYPGNKN